MWVLELVAIKATSFVNIKTNEAYFLVSLMLSNWYLIQLSI